jgi:hypothetical protein
MLVGMPGNGGGRNSVELKTALAVPEVSRGAA